MTMLDEALLYFSTTLGWVILAALVVLVVSVISVHFLGLFGIGRGTPWTKENHFREGGR